MNSKIYSSLLYKSHFLGIPSAWFFFSGIVASIIYIFNQPIAFLCFIFLSLLGRFIAIYYDHQFARIGYLKILLLSIASDKWLHFSQHKEKSLAEDINTIFNSLAINFNFIKFLGKIKNKLPRLNIDTSAIYAIRNLDYISISHIEDNFLYHKNGSVSILLEVVGIDYSTMGVNAELLHQNKVTIFNSLANHIVFSYYFLRKLKSINPKSLENNVFRQNKTAELINSKWLESFAVEYKNKYYIMLTAENNIITKISKNKQNLKQKLNDTFNIIIDSLSAYVPRKIDTSDELAQIITDLYGGYPCASTKNQIPIDALLNNPFKINKYAVFSSGEFSAFINIKNYLTKNLPSNVFQALSQVDSRITFYTHFETQPPQIIKEKLNRKKRRNQAISENNEEIVGEMAEVAGEIEAGNLKIAEVNMGIQVFGDNEKDLQANLNQIFELLQKNAIQPQIERGIFLGYYYAILPSGRKFNPRKVYMTTDNLATIFAPTKSATGFDKNPFGNMPISRFYTTTGEIYKFNFHSEDGSLMLDPPGHTMVIGSTGTGKTTIVNFLLSQSLKYQDLRIFILDQLRGQYIFTKGHNGIYRDLNKEGMNINPFSLKDTIENRTFLSQFLRIMLSANEDETIQINNTIHDTIGSEKSNLTIFSELLGKNNNKLKRKLEEWTKKNYKGHFSGNATIKFTQIDCFNMTAIMKDEKLRALYAYYFYYQFMLQNKGKKGIIFFDELKSYLDTEIGELFLTLTEQARKDNKLVIGGTQNILQMDNLIGHKILENIATFIIFPVGQRLSKTAESIYRDIIGLNSQEVAFLTSQSPDSRMCLIKKQNYSVIIHANLKYLADYLKVFNSNQASVENLKKILEAT